MLSQSSRLHPRPQQALLAQGQNRGAQTSVDAQKQNTRAKEGSKGQTTVFDIVRLAFSAGEKAAESALNKASSAKDPDHKAVQKALKDFRFEFEKLLNEAESWDESFVKWPYLKAFQATQDFFRKIWSEGEGRTKPSSELYNCATLVDILRQGRFKTINHIVVIGLEDPQLGNVVDKLYPLLNREIEPEQVVLAKQEPAFRQIHVIGRIRHFYKNERKVDLKIDIADHKFTTGFKDVLQEKSLGFNITPNAQNKCSKTTLLYDVRWGEQDLQELIKNLKKQGELPAAILTRDDSIRLCPEARDPPIAP